jgi:hypothetical protein
VPVASQFRSTWLAGSIKALRSRGLFDAYYARLKPDTREKVLAAVAGTWLPTVIAVEHYEACEALGIPRDEQIVIGREVTVVAHGTVLDTAVKLATGLGANPWTLLSQVDKLWKRIWIGGAVAVWKVGPKDARVDIEGWPCSSVPYCRNAMIGVLAGVTELVSRKAFVQPIASQCTANSLGYRIAWA